MSRIAELAARRAAIVERSSLLRARMIECSQDFERSMAGVERGVRVVRKTFAKPLLLAAGAGLLFWLRPRKLFAWASRGLFVVSLARRVRRLLSLRVSFRKSRRDYPPARLAG